MDVVLISYSIFFGKTEILNYSIESEEKEEAYEPIPKNKKTRETNNWTDVGVFSTMTEAVKYLKDRGYAKRDKKTDADESVKYKYRCKFAKRRAKIKCKSEYRIYEPSYESNKFIVQTNGAAHNHDQIVESDQRIHFSFEMLDLIYDLKKTRMAAKKIQEHLTDLKENFQFL